ncbi:hypothetical protein R1sor_021631 [Riccia sorocarpa]|uniref:Uncharacterized protein n=1 Tax=Riccia sorocarpa TaxID=122646 RepID=A0ABD3GHK5_9MARC
MERLIPSVEWMDAPHKLLGQVTHTRRPLEHQWQRDVVEATLEISLGSKNDPASQTVALEAVKTSLFHRGKSREMQGLRSSSAVIQLIASATKAIWNDRNSLMFRNRRSILPIRQILLGAEAEVAAALNARANEGNWNRGLQATRDIGSWVDTEAERRTGINVGEGSNRRSPVHLEGQEPTPPEEATVIDQSRIRQLENRRPD